MVKNKIVVIGRGNVAHHIIKAINSSDILELAGNYTRDSSSLPVADVYIVAVSDDAIKTVTQQIAPLISKEAIILHTSGSKGIDEICPSITNRGVLYPFQTFTKEIEVDMKEVHFLLEYENDYSGVIINRLANELSDKVSYCSSEKRSITHLSAVFAINFSNHSMAIAQEMMNENGLDFDMIKPLISECFKKAMSAENIFKMQTGPAIREDYGTINKQKKLLADKKAEYRVIYDIMTNSIIKNGKF